MVAEYEREKITERMTRGRRLKVQTGECRSAWLPPYGYRLTDVDGKRALVIREAEARIVRLIFVWYTVGDGGKGPLPIYAIAKRLTESRVPSRADSDQDRKAEQARLLE
jgi:site-specific DNA recombinase